MESIEKWTGWPHVIETQQFSADVLDHLMRRVVKAENAMIQGIRPDRQSALFPNRRRLRIYREEPSTRTVETFWEAGNMLGYETREIQAGFSSEMKGESFEYRIMALTQVGGMGHIRLADVIVIRSKIEGAARKAVEVIESASIPECPTRHLPVINAGDGSGQHPTQALVDLATIWQERKTGWKHPLEDITILFVGDVRYSRTVNSLCYLLGKFGRKYQIRVIFCSHEDVGPKPGILEYFDESGIAHEITEDLQGAIRHADVVNVTRLQRERFPSLDIYERVRGRCVFKKEYLDLLKKGAFVAHPLPINEDPADPPPEIDPALMPLALGGDPRCAWGRQSLRGVVNRYVLLDHIEAGLQAEETA